MKEARVSLEKGLAASKAGGTPISAKYEVEDGKLQVFDVWESQEAFDDFLTYLGPIMQELGIELAQEPVIMPIVDLVQQ